jgi:hypothetical protein
LETKEEVKESVRSQLMRIRQSLERGKWSNAKILVHSEVEFGHFTLVATEGSSGEVHYYSPEAGEFKPLNLAA